MTKKKRNDVKLFTDAELISLETWRKNKVIERIKTEVKRRRTSLVIKEGSKEKVNRQIRMQATTLQEEIKKYTKKAGITRVKKELAFVESWYTLVGQDLAQETRPVSFQQGVLIVEVFSPSRLQELKNFYKEQLLSDFQKAVRSVPVRDILFRLGTFDKKG